MLEYKKPLVFKNILPKKICDQILLFLVTKAKWEIAKDSLHHFKSSNFQDFLTQGHQFVSFEKKLNTLPSTWENIEVLDAQHINYYMIFAWHTIMEKLGEHIYKNEIARIFWNYYDSTAQPISHRDVQNVNCLSMVFDLQSGKGATKIGEYTFVDEVGQVKVFNSTLWHQGIIYDKKVRFNCNIVSLRQG